MSEPVDTPNPHPTGGWLRDILEKVRSGGLPVEAAVSELSKLPYEELGYATLDHHRGLRLGFPEVVFGQGKIPEQVLSISQRLLETSEKLLVTRISPEAAGLACSNIPDAVYNETARTMTVDRAAPQPGKPGVTVITGGTADIPVAEEAVVTAGIMGMAVEKFFDIGVAGLHRALGRLPQLREAHVVVVVAGMEGALASVIGGLVSVPIIAVPTSVGYGASFDGLAPLLTMLNSCAPGVSVVNIDNGFGAGYLAAMINLQHGDG